MKNDKIALDIFRNQADEKAALWRLAHFEPNCKDDYGNQLLDYLILDALSTYGSEIPIPLVFIHDYILKTYHLEFDNVEIKNSCILLSNRNLVFVSDYVRNEEPTVKISEEMFCKINDNLHGYELLENKIFQEWNQELIVRYENIENIEKHVKRIVDIFKNFLLKLLARHGVECVYLLYSDNDKAKKWQEKYNGSLFSDLPKTNALIDSIIKIEFPKFFLKDDPDRRNYIFRAFNSSFLLHLIQIDDKCSRLFKEITKGQKLFLDNNVLYHLSGFNGGNVLRCSHNMIKYAYELGYELWVTEKTLDEYHDSLIWRMKEYRKEIPLPSFLAQVAVDNLEQDSFLVSYWKDLVEKGTSIEEFVAEKSNIEEILNGLHINKTNEYREIIEDSPQYIEEQAILSGVAREDTNQFIIEHDAFHRIFISKIRGSYKYIYHDAVAWFLTTDTKLPVYDRVARKGKDYLPFCLTIDQWIQFNRPFITRTNKREDYEIAFQVLVTQPYIRAMVSNQPMEKTYQKVLGKLAKYENMTTQLAFEIVTDTDFMLSVNSVDGYQNLDEKIESEFLSLPIKLQNEKEELETKIISLQEQIMEKEIQYSGSIDEINHTLQNEISARKAAETEKNEFISSVKGISKWVIFLIWTGISIYFFFFNNWINSLPNLETPLRLFIAKCLFFASSSVLGLCIPLTRHWKYLAGTLFFSLLLTIISVFIA